jgi:hypothetical protein
MKSTEHTLQVACVQWLRAQYPNVPFTAIPNAAKRTPRQGKWMKDEGLQKGFPDLLIAKGIVGGGEQINEHTWDFNLDTCDIYHGLFCELKSGRNKQSPEQLEWMEKLRNEAYKVEVIRSIEEFIEVVNEYLK